MTSGDGVRLHDLNTDFRWIDRTGPFRRVTEAQAHSYDERGFFLFEHAFTPSEMAEVIAEIDPFGAKIEELLERVEGGRISL
jgi:hypothetical protein